MVAAWPFYLVGTLLILTGFVALSRWMKGIGGVRGDPPGHVLGAAAVAFLLGTGSVVAAIAFDSEQIRAENTRIFAYRVTLELGGPDTVRLLLPAPLDPRLYPRLNATNGTAGLRLVTSGGLALELTADRNVTFDIRVELVGAPFNRSLSRFLPSTPPERSGAAAARVDLVSLTGGGAEVFLFLRVDFQESCFSTRHILAATLQPGSSPYPVQSTVTRC